MAFSRFVCIMSISCGFASASAASAQETGADVNAGAIPRVAASQTPVVGEVVISQAGEVGPYFKKVETCGARGCRVFIYDRRIGALVSNDGVWSPAYARTGVGREVIRIEPFSEAERPVTAPRDDAPLRSAPHIRVREVPAERN